MLSMSSHWFTMMVRGIQEAPYTLFLCIGFLYTLSDFLLETGIFQLQLTLSNIKPLNKVKDIPESYSG